MANIAYAGIPKIYLDKIKVDLVQNSATFTKVPVDCIDANFATNQKHALLIGEQTQNPIRLAQAAYAVDNCLSILIISDPNNYSTLKKALLFTPFIGSTVSCVSGDKFNEFGVLVKDLIEKTNQRRRYSALKQVRIPLSLNLTVEQLKREYIDHFFDKAPIGALLLDQFNSILTLNTHALLILKKVESELLGKYLFDLFPQTIIKEVRKVLENEAIGDQKRTFMYTAEPEKYVELSISKVILRGNTNYKAAIIRDVTEKVLKDQKIEQQIRELNRINTDLDNFVYTASHDLKAPIANLESILSLFKKGTAEKLDEKEKKLIDLMDLSINKFKNTIQDLTEISKLQMISDDLELIEFKDVLEGILFNIDNIIKESGAEIFLDLKVTSITYSKKDLNSILFNLVSNAIKYHSPGRNPKILIKTELNNDRVLLSVKDNGLGIDLKQIDKIFSMFKRLHKHVDGTGIGLYIVKKVVENHGGRIEVESKVGEGSLFKVFL